jgi:hypothetical protein
VHLIVNIGPKQEHFLYFHSLFFAKRKTPRSDQEKVGSSDVDPDPEPELFARSDPDLE